MCCTCVDKSSPAPKGTKVSTIGGHNPATTPVSSVKKTQSELGRYECVPYCKPPK